MLKSNVKHIMALKGETVDGMAVKTLLSTRTISKARTDAGIAECRLSTLKRIADCLEVPIGALYEDVSHDQ